MWKVVTGLALLLVATPALAQLSAQEAAQCTSDTIAPAIRINNCTQLINSGHLASANVHFAYYARGKSYEDLQMRDKAISDYSAAIGASPRFGQAYAHRGFNYAALKNYNQALKDENTAISLEPNKALNYLFRAVVFEGMGAREKAIADYRAALKLEPANSAALKRLAALGAK